MRFDRNGFHVLIWLIVIFITLETGDTISVGRYTIQVETETVQTSYSGNLTCMDIWLSVYNPALSSQISKDLQETFVYFTLPLDERTVSRQPLSSLALLLGGRSNGQQFVNCLTHKSAHCASHAPCGLGGKCVYDVILGSPLKAYHCQCPSGRGGKSCERVTSPCASNPCDNGGTCKTLETGLYRCHCGILYSGQHCEKAWLSRHRFSDVVASLSDISQRLFRVESDKSSTEQSVWQRTSSFLFSLESRITESLRLHFLSISRNISETMNSHEASHRHLEHHTETLPSDLPITSQGGSTRVLQDCSATCMQSSRCPSHIFNVTNGRKWLPMFCNMTIDGGGWIVIQRSLAASRTKFHQTWETYKRGFGNINGDYWLGNENIHTLTNTGNFELRIDFVSQNSMDHYVKYRNFRVDTEANQYQLRIGELTNSSLALRTGQHLDHHNLMPFSTYDRDNDHGVRNCASRFHAGWWYNNCFLVNAHGSLPQFYPESTFLYFDMKIRLQLPL